jgi:hypothetical protein
MKTSVKKVFEQLGVAALLVLPSCSGLGTAPTEEDLVEAYLYAGKPVSDVRLTNLAKTVHDSALRMPRWNGYRNQPDTIDTVVTWVTDSTVDDATVTITSGGRSYGLGATGPGRYRDTSGNLVVAVGQTYRIDVVAGNRRAWAQTTVPQPRGGLTVSRTPIYVDTTVYHLKDTTEKKGKYLAKKAEKIVVPLPMPDSLMKLRIRLNNPDRHYLYFHCYSQDAQYSFTAWHTNADTLGICTIIRQEMAGQTDYVKVDSTAELGLYKPGRYKFIVFSTTPDYQSMREGVLDSTHQDRWGKIPNNINGGLGYFTAFSADSVFFDAVAIAGSGGGTIATTGK